MKIIVAILAVATSLCLTAPSAQAAGCIKGAIAGAVAGHFAGHHGLLGAGAGCVVGRHVANSRAGAQGTQQQYQQGNPATSQ